MRTDRFEVHKYSFEDSWDAIWRGIRFERGEWRPGFRDREDLRLLRRMAETLAPVDRFPSVLDCTCGLGTKTICLAEMGYEVEASDASAEAVRITRLFSEEEGLHIRCLRSRWDELGEKCGRRYDWVFSDAFDLAPTREDLLAAARGICAVLREGGRFVFPGAHQWFTDEEREEVLRMDWEGLQPVEVDPPRHEGDLRVMGVYFHERCPEGIIVNGVRLWEQGGRTRVDVAKDWIRCFRWTWEDFVGVLTDAGFAEVYSRKLKGFPARAPYIPNVAER